MTAINIVVDGSGSPDSPAIFVDVESDDGASVNVGEWRKREDGLFSLRIASLPGEHSQKSLCDELHSLLDTVDAAGNADVSEFHREDLSSLGQTLYDVLKRSQSLTNRYAHYFRPDDKSHDGRFCERCGLYLTDATHIRG